MAFTTREEPRPTVPEFPALRGPAEPRPNGVLHRIAYAVSLPERGIRWTVGLLGSGLRSALWLLPRRVREGRFFKTAVERQVRLLTDEVGQARLYPGEAALDRATAARLGIGNAVDNLLVLSLHSSPVWILLAAADLSAGARSVVADLAEELRSAGVLKDTGRVSAVESVLQGLANLSAGAADTLDLPPLTADQMRQTVERLGTELRNVGDGVVRVADVDGLAEDLRMASESADRSLWDTTAAIATGTVDTAGTWITGVAVGTTATFRLVGRELGDVLADWARAARRVRRLGFYGSLRSFLRPHTDSSRRLLAYPFVSWTEIALSAGAWRSAPWRLR